MQPNQEPTVAGADVNDVRRPRPDSKTVRPDGWLPVEPAPVNPPVDNSGAPPQILVQDTLSMDDVMAGMGVFSHPYSFESDHPRGPVRPPDPRPGT